MMSYDYPHPVSRTYQYKKITKPLLERKRRARINRCLEELKDLMVDALETEGENISKLEKADILELTVRHLQRLQTSRPSGLSISASPNEEASAESRWQSGFGHCAAEACRFLASLPGEAADRLARHLSTGLQSPKPKNEQDVSRATLVSPTLKNLERTANIIAPCQPLNSSIETGTSVIVEKRIISTNGPTQQHLPKSETINSRLEIIKSPYSRPQTLIDSDDLCPSIIRRNSDLIPKNNDFKSENRYLKSFKTKIDKSESVIDDEEEIDVVRIDESCDPMWRPW